MKLMRGTAVGFVLSGGLVGIEIQGGNFGDESK